MSGSSVSGRSTGRVAPAAKKLPAVAHVAPRFNVGRTAVPLPAPNANPGGAPQTPPRAGGLVTLRSVDAPLVQVTVALTDAPSVSGGVGGWESVARPGRDPVLWWRGGQDTTLTLEGIIDGTRRRARGPDTRSVADRVRDLYALGRRRGQTSAPTVVRVFGDLTDHHSAGGGLWVVQGLTVTPVRHTAAGVLAQAAATIDLVAYTPVAAVTGRVQVRRTRATAKTGAKRTTVTRRGDTLRGVAIREYGNAAAWRRLLDSNRAALGGKNPVSPDAVLRPGLRLKVT